jgi:hypothetical protein
MAKSKVYFPALKMNRLLKKEFLLKGKIANFY